MAARAPSGEVEAARRLAPSRGAARAQRWFARLLAILPGIALLLFWQWASGRLIRTI